MIFLRQLDVVLLLLALPIFIVSGEPLLGWAATTVAWIGQKALQAVLERKAANEEDARRFFGLHGRVVDRTFMAACPYDLRRRHRRP